MSDIAQENMQAAQRQQKTWYDQKARERSFQPDDQVLVLLPMSPAKLTAQWQGPYRVIRPVGKVNYMYLIHMPDRRNKRAVLHVNMLQKWHTQVSTGFLAQEVAEDREEDIPSWKADNRCGAKVGSQLTPTQAQELHSTCPSDKV